MAVDPTEPFSREEMYLAAAAGEGVEVPPCPWSRKEAYLADIGGRLDDMDTRIAALATDISFKGSVATETDLPSGAAVGDAYITEDTGVMYVWVGDSWVALGGTGINVVQTTGTSTTDVMSQKAATNMVYSSYGGIRIGDSAPELSPGSIYIGSQGIRSLPQYSVYIGRGTGTYQLGQSSTSVGGLYARATGSYASAFGSMSAASGGMAMAAGAYASAAQNGSVALGAYSSATSVGQVDIGSTDTSYGYNSTNYRLLTGVYDPVNAHDAATKNYVDGLVGNIESALHAINNGGNA